MKKTLKRLAIAVMTALLAMPLVAQVEIANGVKVGGLSSGSTGGTAFNVTNAPYSCVGDASTDNATCLAAVFTATNAITGGIPTIYFPCQTGKQCQYNYSGSGTSAINPTIATTILCDTGVNLHYTGSAHMMDIGPSGLTSADPYNNRFSIFGCKLTDSGTATDDIYINPFVTTVEIAHVTTYDSPLSASSTAWGIYASGGNWHLDVHDNDCTVDNNTAINCYRSVASGGTDPNSQAHFSGNRYVCWPSSTPSTGCATTSGIGLWIDGWGSTVTNENFGFMQPDLRIGPNGYLTKATDNYFETSPTSTIPAIQFGNPGDGAATDVSGLMITNNSCATQGVAAFMGPTTANDILTNTVLDNLHCVSTAAPTSVPFVTLNNTAGQIGNEVKHLQTATSGVLLAANYYVHTLGANITPWIYVDHLSFSDSFSGSGALAQPWLNASGAGIGASLSVTSGAVSCSTGVCVSFYGEDTALNQTATITISTVPTGTDQAAVITRSNGATTYTAASYYTCVYVSGTGIQLYKNVANSFTQLGTTYTTVAVSSGDQLILKSIGNAQTCYLVHSTGTFKAVGPISDSTAPLASGGYTGMELSGTSGRLGPFTVESQP